MQWRFLWQKCLIVPVLLCLIVVSFAACGGNPPGTQGSQGGQHVNLHWVSWIGGDQLPTYHNLIKQFETANPTISVNYEVLPYANLGPLLKARFGAGNAPDLMSLFAGSFKDQFVNAGDLVDLSNDAWASRLNAASKPAALASDGKKVVVMPASLSAVAVIYNKSVFAAHNLSVPQTWTQFLQVCQALKQAGVAPITMGAKDTWPLAYIPDTMLLQTVYKKNASFDAQLLAGKTTYANSGWVDALKDVQGLNTSGYLYKSILGTDYQGSEDLLATGKAAMTISGQFSLISAKQTNPSADLGMFPLPYASSATVPTYVDQTVAIASSSKHIDAARKFLNFLAEPSVSAAFLKVSGSFPPFSDVTPQLDPGLQQLMPAIQASSADMTTSITYPGTTNDTLEKGIQAMWAGTDTPLQVAQSMDKAAKG